MAETGRAMVLRAFGAPLEQTEFPRPELAPGAVLLRVTAAGVCGSDLDIVDGHDPRVPLPLVPGHEALGEVVAVGGERRDAWGTELAPGMPVAFNRGVSCGRCVYCAVKQQPALCPHRQTYGISVSCAAPPHFTGCYAEYLYVRPESEIFVLPPDADPIGLVAATCSGATAAHAVELAGVRTGDLVVVIGPGPLGLYAAALSREAGARAVVMVGTGRHPQALRLAEAGGCVPLSMAETTDGDRQEFVRELGRGWGAEVVIDCAGTPDSLQEALRLVARGGTIAFPGVATPMAGMAVDPYFLAREQIRLQGVWVSEPRHLWQALLVGASGRYPLDAVVSQVYPLREANEALELLRARKAVKVVLCPD